MVHTHTAKGNRRYRYYVCETAKQRGYARCPTRSIPAGEIEQFVVGHIRKIAIDPTIVAATLVEARQQAETRIEDLKQEQAALTRQLQRDHAEMQKLVATNDEHISARLANLQERTSVAERRAIEIRDEINALSQELISEAEVFAALARFDPVWDSLSIREQSRVIELLVDRVEYDGEKETVTVTFLPSGLRAFTRHPSFAQQDDAA
jgi:site-specific DNA recombinase